ncbi:hypothetical protein AMELA_G00240100 [Ameiurus melas]|uniref:Uncharacterized protein n=1 Tax=Ameiurus melas TaxID=219545 RepID=A0A7J5ZXT8_AMEME|nr:hypothetical protein AMELA_G00240100 [Ameiurus melas]
MHSDSQMLQKGSSQYPQRQVLTHEAQTTFTYDLQDTIKKLRSENAYLQHRLETLTQALHELKRLLDHSRDHEFSETSVAYDRDQLHAWNEWIHNGISAETHYLIEQAFCLSDHDLASAILPAHILILMSCTIMCNVFVF